MRARGKRAREESRVRKEGRPKKEKRLGIVSSYVTWMSNNFGARGCRISNVEAGRLQPQPGHRCHAPLPHSRPILPKMSRNLKPDIPYFLK